MIDIHCFLLIRYEKELTHPIQNLLSGELARALLIQVDTCSIIISLCTDTLCLRVFSLY